MEPLPTAGLVLRGPEVQALRLLIRNFRNTFAAIDGFGLPMWSELISLASSRPDVLDALLVLSDYTRFIQSQAHSTLPYKREDFKLISERYQETLSSLQTRVSMLQTFTADTEEILEAVSLACLLSFVGISDSYNWPLHVDGTISLLKSVDSETLNSRREGHYLQSLTAVFDIRAFTLGRREPSRRAWLDWRVFRGAIDSDRSQLGSPFSSFEITIGYPESLVTIIAFISAAIEDMANSQSSASLFALAKEFSQRSGDDVAGLDAAANPNAAVAGDTASTAILKIMETMLESWTPPQLPGSYAALAENSLNTAWEVIRKAAMIYLWRKGFSSNIFRHMPRERKAAISKFCKEILFALHCLIGLRDSHSITISNALVWSTVVVANESGSDAKLQADVLKILKGYHARSALGHLEKLTEVLLEFWQRIEHSQKFASTGFHSLSLEDLSRELQLCIPLL